MKYFFEEHKGEPLVTKSLGYYTFTVRNGLAEIADEPYPEGDQDEKARALALKQREQRVDAWNEAARELGGVPLVETRVEITVEEEAVEVEVEAVVEAETENTKSSKGGKK